MHPRTYPTFSGPLDSEARLFAALLYCGAGAVLSDVTAAQLWGLLDGGVREPFHLAVPEHRRVAPRPGLVVRRSARIDEATHPTFYPPRTYVEETVLDLVQQSATADEALALVARACQRRLTSPDRLVAAAAQRGTLRWRGDVLSALGDVAGGAHSVLEVKYLRGVERAHGLPEGERQVLARSGRRRVYRDVRYRKYRTLVELDGRLGHDDPGERWRDRRRDNAGVVEGEATLRYGWSDVVGDPCGCAAQVAAVLRQRGWTGKPRRCGNGCTL